jgi:hypothetical protein
MGIRVPIRETAYGPVTPPRRAASARFILLLALCVSATAVRAEDGCPLPAGGQERWAGENAWKALQAQNYRIGKIEIQIDNVFDLDDPDEQTWYAYTADTLHIATRPGVIESLLLFKTGDALEPRLIFETERRLLAQSYLRYARIVPLTCHDGEVDVAAHVKDAWTLKASLKFAHVGGQTSSELSFEDVNFAGTGKTVQVEHQSDTQRTTNQLSYADPALFGTPWQMDATYAHLSDGRIESFNLGQPFYEDTVPWSFFVHYTDQKQTLYFYNQGNAVWFTADTQQRFELDWSQLLDWRDDTGRRVGATYLYQNYTYGALRGLPPLTLLQPPLPRRRFGGPALTAEFFQDRYQGFSNLALMGRDEDYNMGWDTRGQLGYFGRDFGSGMPAWYYNATSTFGTELADETVLLSNGSLQGRRSDGLNQNILANLIFTFYNQYFPSQTLVAHGQLQSSLRPDPENYTYIGGLQGMPAYPNYYFIGDRAWQIHLADRIFTHSYLFNTFQIGFVAYADVGQIRQLNDSGWSPRLADAGVGFRLGDVRSAYGGVIYVTFAWPLVKEPGANEREFIIGNILNF